METIFIIGLNTAHNRKKISKSHDFFIPQVHHVFKLFAVNQIFLLTEFIANFVIQDKTLFQRLIYGGYIFVDILSAGLIMWRFAAMNRRGNSFIRLVKLLRREDRSR